MSLDFFSGLTERRQAPRFILLTIILMTLPCYCLGAVLLATAPDNNKSNPRTDSTISTLSVSTSSPAATVVSPAAFHTFTPIGQPLRPTSTQLYLRTAVPIYPTWTFIPTIFITAAPPPTSTFAPTLTPLPTNAPPPTNTLPPSENSGSHSYQHRCAGSDQHRSRCCRAFSHSGDARIMIGPAKRREKSWMVEDLIKQLSALHAPSGFEGPVRDLLREVWGGLVDEFQMDGLGSLIGLKHGSGAEPRRRLMICAHMDEIGLMVAEVRDGFIRTATLGGIDYRPLLAQPVLVHGRRDLPGVFGAAPPHMARTRKKYPEADDLWIDVGLPAAEVAELVRIGDPITFDSPPVDLKGDRIAGKSMDNRVSLAALTLCLQELQQRTHVWDVYAVASAQEEIGTYGAITSAYQIQPDIAVAVDTTYGIQPGVGDDEGFALGGGPTIGLGPNFHPRLYKAVRDIASANEIKVQTEPLPGNTGTDAWVIQVSRDGVPSLLLSIPIRNMHTPVEVVDVRDVKRTGRLLAAIVAHLEADFLAEIAWPVPGENVMSLELLRELSNAIGVSGDEGEVRDIILKHIRGYVEDIRIDPMGSIHAVRRGTGAVNLRVMAAAHMDEVGMMVMDIESDGTLSFNQVGGLDARILPGLHVLVGKDRLPGVITWVPIHLNTSDEAVAITRLRIDIGATNRESAEKAVDVGDRVAFDSKLLELGPTVRGKAFDDRAGCASLIKLIQGDPFPFDLHVAFTVQEEVGLRGAQVAAQRIQPDVAFVLETTACHDLPQDPDEPDQTTITRMGAGPAITVMDASMISDPRLVRHLVQVAEQEGIPCQFRSPQHAGGTDAGQIHRSGTGVPSIVIANPCRYLHGPNLVMNLSDFENQSRLVRAAWLALTPAVLER